MNHDDSTDRARLRQALSALADGETSQVDHACTAWRDDPRARADWHAYHLIGELMRSDDVRCAPQRDAQFLGRLRARLVHEPVVLASPTVSRWAVWRRAWAAPIAMAAGFVAVAGVLVVMRVAAPDGVVPDRAAQWVSSVAAPAAGLQRVAAAPSAPSMAGQMDGRLMRNPELDRYLAAHKQFSNTSTLAAPGAMVRNAAVAAPER